MMTDMLDREIARGDEEMAAGRPVDALRRADALLAGHPGEAAPYRLAARALFAALDLPDGLEAWPAPDRDALFRTLVLQPGCPERPFILHRAVADRITGQGGGVERLAAALTPTLRALSRPSPPLPALLLLLVLRPHLGRWMPDRRLRALHLAAFPRFTQADLALPYSAMFNARAFGRNRDDLIDAWRRRGERFTRPLHPRHLTLLSWSANGRLPSGPGLPAVDEADQRSARSLALAGGGTPATADEDVEGQAAMLAAARAGLAAASSRRAALASWRVDAPASRMVEAARSIAAARAPFLRRGDRRVRVAVCVSGQLRGYAHALPTWAASLFAHADVRFFVHSWTRIGRGPAQPWRAVLPFAGRAFTAAYRRLAGQEGMDAFEARYPTLFRALAEGGTVTADQLREAYATPHVVVDDEADPRFAGWSNSAKMHGKIAAAHALAAASGEGFDLFVRLRPDLSLRTQAFAWPVLRAAAHAAPRLWADGAFGVHHGVPMIGDQFAVGAAEPMARYAGTAALYPRLAALGLAGAPPALEGHVSLAQVCWLHGIRVDKAPVRFGRLLEPEPFGSGAILRALETDAAGRHDAIDRALIDAARADLAL